MIQNISYNVLLTWQVSFVLQASVLRLQNFFERPMKNFKVITREESASSFRLKHKNYG